VSQNDSPTQVSFFVGELLEDLHCTNSRQRRQGETHDQSAPQAGRASRRKANSYSEAGSVLRGPILAQVLVLFGRGRRLIWIGSLVAYI
jgi:hypothetical protein